MEPRRGGGQDGISPPSGAALFHGPSADPRLPLAMFLISRILGLITDLPARRLLHQLGETAALLKKHGEKTWSARLGEAAQKYRQAHEAREPGRGAPVLQEVLSYYGGMGSLSDVYLSAHNGHKIKPRDEDAVNARLSLLRTQLFLSLRQALSRSHWTRPGLS